MPHTIVPMTNATETLVSTKLSGKYLTVFLDQESYGIAVLKVRGILSARTANRSCAVQKLALEMSPA